MSTVAVARSAGAKRRRASGRSRVRPALRSWLLLVAGLAIIVVVLFPVYYAVIVALEPSSTILAVAPGVIPHQVTFANFHAAWDNEVSNITASLLVSLGVVLLTLLIATPAAHGLARFRFRGISIVIFALLVTQMVPGISLSIAFYVTFNKLHLLNGYLGLVLADSTYAVPFAVLVLRAYMTSLPSSIFEAAEIDGCGHGRAFLRIALPMALPGIITAGLFAFLFAWGDFLFALTLNSSGSVQPLTLGLYKFVTAFGSNWGPMMATVVLAAIPSGIVLAVAQRWISGGLQAGALKG